MTIPMRVVRKEVKSRWDLSDDLIREQYYPLVTDYVIRQLKFKVNPVWTRVRILIEKDLRSQ